MLANLPELARFRAPFGLQLAGSIDWSRRIDDLVGAVYRLPRFLPSNALQQRSDGLAIGAYGLD